MWLRDLPGWAEGFTYSVPSILVSCTTRMNHSLYPVQEGKKQNQTTIKLVLEKQFFLHPCMLKVL